MTSSFRGSAERRRGIVALVAACALWGVGFPLIKAVSDRAELLAAGISSWFMASLLVTTRFLGAAILLFALRPLLPTKKELWQGLWLGVTTGVGLLLQTDALAYTEASTSAFLTQGYVLFLPLFTALALRRLPPPRVFLCVSLVVLGLAILSRFDPLSLGMARGEAETLLAALCFTFQILVLDAARFAGNRTAPVTNVMFCTVGLVALPVALATGRGAGDVLAILGTAPSLFYWAILLVFPTITAFLLMNRFQRAVTASEAGVIYGTEPVFASALALVLPEWLSRMGGISYDNETLSSRLLLGGSLVVAASVALSLSARPAAELKSELGASAQ